MKLIKSQNINKSVKATLKILGKNYAKKKAAKEQPLINFRN
jgi:hypothetical protein